VQWSHSANKNVSKWRNWLYVKSRCLLTSVDWLTQTRVPADAVGSEMTHIVLSRALNSTYSLNPTNPHANASRLSHNDNTKHQLRYLLVKWLGYRMST